MTWNKHDWEKARQWIKKENGNVMGADELKAAFLDHLSVGHEVLPIGPCDNFDYKIGCKGHPETK